MDELTNATLLHWREISGRSRGNGVLFLIVFSLIGFYSFTMMELPFPNITVIIFIEKSIDIAIKYFLKFPLAIPPRGLECL